MGKGSEFKNESRRTNEHSDTRGHSQEYKNFRNQQPTMTGMADEMAGEMADEISKYREVLNQGDSYDVIKTKLKRYFMALNQL